MEGTDCIDEGVGFYVIAPAVQIEKGIFAEQTKPDHLRRTIQTKVDSYRSGTMLDSGEKSTWFNEWLIPMVDHMKIKVISCPTWTAGRDVTIENGRNAGG
jgi:hypothetical protein